MQSGYRWFFVLIAFGPGTDAMAQIYTCRAADGSRVFSDERCGTDAKVVPGVDKAKRAAAKDKSKGKAQSANQPKDPPKDSAKPQAKTTAKGVEPSALPAATTAAKAAPPKPPPMLKSAAELDELLEQCDAGKVAACNDWTRSGGPNRLREKEREAQLACDSGSLAACEQHYCSDGATEQCRAKVLDTAKMAGQTWYLRDADRKLADGSTLYVIRCIREGERLTQDVSVTCAAKSGPQRCSASGPERAFARLDAAAASYCAR